MSTARYTTVNMPKKLQYFLRGYFECNSVVFSFPRESRANWLPGVLRECLWYPPSEFNPVRDCDFGDKTFRIEIPENNYRDPDTYFYLSKTANKEFVKKVEEFFTVRFNEEMTTLRANHIKGPSAVRLFMDRYKMPVEFEDAIKRAYSRFINNTYNKTYRKKLKKFSVSAA